MKTSALILGISATALLAGASVKHFWSGKVLSKIDVQKKWGASPFEKARFKNAGRDDRAKMAFDLLKHKKDFVGRDSAEIRKELGDFDGYYFRDGIPTYLLHLDRGDHEGSWQLVFLLDNSFKVSDIIVHKMRQLDE